MGLKEYQAKRNFTKTAEPAGRRRASRQGDGLSFVIQKHAARKRGLREPIPPVVANVQSNWV